VTFSQVCIGPPEVGGRQTASPESTDHFGELAHMKDINSAKRRAFLQGPP